MIALALRSRPPASLERYRVWFYAAAFYNLCWGSVVTVAANSLAWQVVGMFVLVYAPAYWWVARQPERHAHLVAIALLGKILGPLGLLASVAIGRASPNLAWVIVTNDVIWWPAFALYLREAAQLRGGWREFLAGA